MSRFSSEETARVLIETVRQNNLSKELELERIAAGSKTSESTVRKILMQFLGDIERDQYSLSSKSKVYLALEIARTGHLKEAARELSWQEFETFGVECLVEAGFRAERNVRVKGNGRAWQIDLVGYRGDLVLTIDCKHWNSSGYESRLQPPARHQRTATAHFLRKLKQKLDSDNNMQALAVILTLLEPPTNFLEKAAIVSVEKLPGFLNAVTPYDSSLPLMSVSDPIVENPIC